MKSNILKILFDLCLLLALPGCLDTNPMRFHNKKPLLDQMMYPFGRPGKTVDEEFAERGYPDTSKISSPQHEELPAPEPVTSTEMDRKIERAIAKSNKR